MAQGVREDMIRSAVALFAERGVAGTRLTDVVAHAGAPRGSIYHHFPHGKDELVLAVLAKRQAAAKRSLAPLEGSEPAAVVDGFIDGWKRVLETSDFASGCSVLGITVTTQTPQTHAGAAAVFEAWTTELARLFEAGGISPASSRSLAMTLIAGAEGAVVMCRALRSVEPLEAVRGQLKAILAGPALGHRD